MERVSNKGQRADGISSDQFLLWSVWLRQKKELVKIPTIKKKIVSITRRVTMRACLERPILPKAKGDEWVAGVGRCWKNGVLKGRSGVVGGCHLGADRMIAVRI